MLPTEDQVQVSKLLRDNKKLLEQNNELLLKIHRYYVWGFWAQIIWYIFLIGLPFALYFYVLEPYFTALGSSYEVFNAGMQEIPGWKQFNAALENFRITSGE
jgi:hypothetical protein